MTDQIPPSQPRQPQPSQARPEAAPPQVADAQLRQLIVALDNANDPNHERAEDDLIRLGAQAVPLLIEALDPKYPWLRAYRAAEALGQIGDGRASRPLSQALNHPNSNVRWAAVRALGKVGDGRALLALRRVARDDRSRTSWGEPVAASAAAALREMQRSSTILRLSDPIRIALLVAVAFIALFWANERITTVRGALNQSNHVAWGTAVTPILPTATPVSEDTAEGEDPEDDEAEATPTVDTAATPTVAPATATVTAPTANVRPAPNTNNDPIAQLKAGDSVQVLGQSGDWYQIQLPDGTGRGWVAASVLSPPSSPVPTVTN